MLVVELVSPVVGVGLMVGKLPSVDTLGSVVLSPVGSIRMVVLLPEVDSSVGDVVVIIVVFGGKLGVVV